ncbi:MAG TPA: hypothetical protein VF212_03405 [Longimicrobiales bacterium]
MTTDGIGGVRVSSRMQGPGVVELLNTVEARLPVSQWTVDGLRVWPFLRIAVGSAFAVARRAIRSGTTPAAAAPGGTSRMPGARILRDVVQFSKAYVRDFSQNQSPRAKYDAVFLISTHHRRVRVRGRWLCPHSQPFLHHLRSLGATALVLERHRNGYRIPRYGRSCFLDVRQRAATKLASRRSPAPSAVKLPGVSELPALLDPVRDSRRYDEAYILATTRSLRAKADYFKSILIRTGARVGFVVCYYNLDGMAFCLACREVGIPSVDIQHGVQGPEHFAYGQWRNIPPEGYELLPSHFWCWSEAEVDTIRAWSAPVKQHTPVLGGNLWINAWKRLRDQLDDAAGLDAVREPGRIDVLYTFGLEPELPEEIRDAIQASPPSWTWWLRLHPGMAPGSLERIRAQLNGVAGGASIELDRATAAPLLSLLMRTDVHVTHYSSVTFEAAAVGVPSVIVHPIGETYYANLIDAGWATVARSGGAVCRAVERWVERRPASAGRLAIHLPEAVEIERLRELLAQPPHRA